MSKSVNFNVQRLSLRLLALINLFWVSSAVYGTTYYVSNNGNDSNDGSTLTNAFSTLQHAANQVTAGDEVLVENGTYVGFNMTTSGSANNPILFQALGAGAVINQPNEFTNKDGINIEGGNWVIIDGFICQNLLRAGIRVVTANNCIVRNNTCLDNGVWGIFSGFTDDLLLENNECANAQSQHGIYVSNSSDRAIIRHNECHGNYASGIQINADASLGGDGISSDAQIYNNILYNNGVSGGAAINLDGAVDARIFNNLLYDNHATGITLFQIDAASPSINAKIYHNTIIQAADGRWGVLIVNGSTGAKLFNNIVITKHPWRGTVGVDAASASGLLSDYNIFTDRLGLDGDNSRITLAQWRASTGQDVNSQVADPLNALFVLTNDNYRLLPGSQAVDAGTALAYLGADTDILGVSRPRGAAFDVGAYEFNLSYANRLQIYDSSLSEDNGDGLPGVDSNQNGVPNLIEYALDVPSPNTMINSLLPIVSTYSDGSNLWVSFDWRENKRAGDLYYAVEYSYDLSDPSSWNRVVVDGIDSVQSILDEDIDGDNTAYLNRISKKVNLNNHDRCFYRLTVEVL